MPTLAGLYHLLTFTYPRDYRDSHQREIVGTLLEASSDRQRVPRLREAWALVVCGLRLRAFQAHRRGLRWLLADALRVGAALSVISLLPISLRQATFSVSPWRPDIDPLALAYPVMLALTVIALFRRPRKWGLLLVAGVLGFGGQVTVSIPALHSSMGPFALVGYLSVVVPCVVSAIAFLVADSGRRSGSWSWWWLVGLLVPPVFVPLIVSPLLVVVALTAASLIICDSRWSVAALVVSVVLGLGSGAGLVGGTQSDLVFWGALAAISVIATLVVESRPAPAS